MNPNMMGAGMPMGQVPDVPTTKELWKNEKTQYRHWMILFGIGILVIFALLLTSLILNLVNKDSIIIKITEWGEKNPESLPDYSSKLDPKLYNAIATDFANAHWKSTIIYTSVKAALAFVAIVLFTETIFKAYKTKSFAKLSQWASFFVGITALIGVFGLFQLIRSSNLVMFSYSEGIFEFILLILPIFIWLFISRPVNKIKRTFILSERVEAFKNSPQYAQMQAQMEQMQNGQVQPGNMGPYGPVQPQAPVQPANPNVTPATNPAVKKELSPSEKRRKELNAMKLEQLKEVAKKLSISGYSSMKKAELIDNIIRVSEV